MEFNPENVFIVNNEGSETLVGKKCILGDSLFMLMKNVEHNRNRYTISAIDMESNSFEAWDAGCIVYYNFAYPIDDISSNFDPNVSVVDIVDHIHKIIEDMPVKRMTNYDLAYWLWEGTQKKEFREVRNCSGAIYSFWLYEENEAKEFCRDGLAIRINGGPWNEPII